MEMDDSVNVLGGRLEPCSFDPITGFYRDGCCNTAENDYGQHTVCIEVNQHFLEYSRFRGNDLSTPMPDFNFPGLKSGDRWCLCAKRWLEAYEHNMAPKIYIKSTHFRTLDIIPLRLLLEYALDIDSKTLN